MASNTVAKNIKSNCIDTSEYPRKPLRPTNAINVPGTLPKKRQDVLRWGGWGYKDCGFHVEDGHIHFRGSDRYPIVDGKLPLMTEQLKTVFDIDLKEIHSIPAELPNVNEVPKSKMPKNIIDEIENMGISCSIDHIERSFRSYGQYSEEIHVVLSKLVKRVCDLIVWPMSHEEVEKVVQLASKNNLVIVPVGGCTNVSEALVCPPYEKRPIIALDTTQMNRILWIDESSMQMCCESGIIGQDLEREMKKLGFTVGHEPDSYEFSTVGGWVATRASGMKKNMYGNIEDLVIHVRMVTTEGVLEKGCHGPRISSGPDFDHVIMGSEGNFGVVTEVTLKIRPIPKFTRYGSILFPNFESGVKCLREIAHRRIQPSSIRLLDNFQTKLGQSLRPAPGYLEQVMGDLKRMYIQYVKGMDLGKLCLVTMLFEGEDDDQLVYHQNEVNVIAFKHGGVLSGASYGKKGYVLTFVIAYLRDIGVDIGVIGDSIETSVPWNKVTALYNNVQKTVKEQCDILKVTKFEISQRLTQTYDSGCCFYFYLLISTEKLENPSKTLRYIEDKARDAIITSGGSISHHHGVGKLRKKWYKETVSTPGLNILKGIKSALDPKNVFAVHNLM